mmetsp:Transcript_30487/g.66787  ORF Transcript_30487/g.66787 Transcript_30487/m.66787 type:complete len:243 (-) Transcript_30487:262-990(-)
MPRLDPLVLKRLLGGEPSRRIHHQQLPNEVLSALRDLAPDVLFHIVVASLDEPHLHILAAGEGHVAEECYENRHSQAPEVALRGVAPLQDLGCNVGERSTTQGHFHVRLPDLAEAEVDEFQVVAPLSFVEEVLQLDVSVHHAMTVDIVHCQKHLVGCVGGIPLSKAFFLLHTFEELAPGHAFHDKTQHVLVLVHIYEASNMRVVHGKKNLSLGLQLLLLLSRHSVQLEALHRELRTRRAARR